jgi:asparagine synthase (glutamine-hydrolysing)
MLNSLHQEEFYVRGAWQDQSLGLYVGWTAHKGSSCDTMPLGNESGDIHLVVSGDEYPDPARIQHLRNRGHSIVGSGAAYLVHAYEEDADFPRGLNGMFHGVIADQIRGTVSLFNDRYGMHRLYYYEAKNGFYFAAEAKAILAVRPELREWDLRSLGEFVSFSCVLENRTIFKDILALPAASFWTFQRAQLRARDTYFSPSEWESQATLDFDSYHQALRSALETTLPRYFAGPQQLGMAVTGGLDTRVILSTQAPAADSLKTYTFSSKLRESYDVRIGRRVAEMCQQPHQVIEAGDEFLAEFPHYAEQSVFLTEGAVDLSRTSDLYVSRQVREIAPAKIVGTYGSEIVRHAVMFKPVQPVEGLYSADFLPYVAAAEETYAALRREHPVTFAAFRQSPWYHHGVLALEQSQLTVRSPFMDNEFVRAVYRAPAGDASGQEDVRLRLIQDGNPKLARIRSDRGVGGSGTKLGRVATRAWREFTFKAEYAYDEGMPQSVARVDHALSGLHLERLFLGRHKLLHYRIWYRDQLANYVRQMLLDPMTLSRQYLQPKTLERVVQSHTSGTANHTTALQKLLALELLHRLFLSGQATSFDVQRNCLLTVAS